MNFTAFVVMWAVVAVITLGIAFYRNLVLVMHEDDCVHVAEAEARLIPQQVMQTNKLRKVDLWGKSFTVVTAVFGLVLAGIYLYQGWVTSIHPY